MKIIAEANVCCIEEWIIMTASSRIGVIDGISGYVIEE